MPQQFCTSCGAAVMATMRICPTCGNRSFSPTPVAPANAGSQGPQAGQGAPNSTTVNNQFAQGPTFNGLLPAGHGKRLIAYLIDYVAVVIGAAIIGAFAGFTGAFAVSGGGALAGGLLYLVGVIFPIIYFTYFHSRPSGQTWGKAAMGIRVVTLGGDQLTKVQAFVRAFLTLLVPIAGWIFIGLSAVGTMSSQIQSVQQVAGVAVVIGIIGFMFGPYATVFFSRQHQTLFDMICRTCVVMK